MVFRQFYRKKGFHIYTTVSIEIWFVRFVNFVICLSSPLHANWGNSVASIFSWHIHAMSVNAHSIYLSARPMELFSFIFFSVLFSENATRLDFPPPIPALTLPFFSTPFFFQSATAPLPPPSAAFRSRKVCKRTGLIVATLSSGRTNDSLSFVGQLQFLPLK